MILLLIFLLYLLPIIIIHVIGYIIWKMDPDANDQHTIKDLYEYYIFNYDEFFILATWLPTLNIMLLIAFILFILFTSVSKIRIK